MSYFNMQPGLQRRNAYSRLVMSRSLPTVTRLSNGSIVFTRNAEEIDAIDILDINYNDRYFQRETDYDMSYEALSDLKDVRVGLVNSSLIDNTRIEVNSNNKQFCVICQEDISISSIVRTLKCDHIFHINCIDRWFVDHKNCPTCKQQI